MRWTLLVVASLVTTVSAYLLSKPGLTIASAVAVVATIFAGRAAHYNARVYRSLLALWERSFMCARCGEIFATRIS